MNKKGLPNKKLDLFFTKNLNNSFVSSRSGGDDSAEEGKHEGAQLKRQKSNKTIMQ